MEGISYTTRAASILCPKTGCGPRRRFALRGIALTAGGVLFIPVPSAPGHFSLKLAGSSLYFFSRSYKSARYLPASLAA